MSVRVEADDSLEQSVLRCCEDWLQRGYDDARIQVHPTDPDKCLLVLDRQPVALDQALFDDCIPSATVVVAPPQPGDRPTPQRRIPSIPADMFLMGAVPSWAREPRRRVIRTVSRSERRIGQQIVYYCHECFRIQENVALWMALWMGRCLTLPVVALMITEPPQQDAQRGLRTFMAPPYRFRRLHMQRTMRDALHAWGIPALLFRAVDPVAILRSWTAVHPPHIVVADEFVSHPSRLAFDAFSRTLPHCVFAFSSGLVSAGVFDVNAAAVFDADSVRKRFDDDVARILFDMAPSKVPDAEVQAPLFVDGTRRVYLDAALIKRMGVPDAAAPGALPALTSSEMIELGLTSPFRCSHLADRHVQRQHAIWLATRSNCIPTLPGGGDARSIGFQEIVKGLTPDPVFNTLQERLRSKKGLEPGERRQWARLLWELVAHPNALSWACEIWEQYDVAVRRPILEFQFYLDMVFDPGS